MPLKISDLGYTLAPGERFAEQDDCVEDDEVPELDSFAKSEINREKEIYNKINEINLKPVKGDKEVPWYETLSIVGDISCDQNLDKNHSLKLEEHFKELSSVFVKTGLKKLEKLNVPFNRPSDFYAEMMKSDEHMNLITKKLENKQKQEANRNKNKRVKKNKQKNKRKELESQAKNKFIKNVNLLKKKHKGEDMDKQIDKLISNTNNNSRYNTNKKVKQNKENNRNKNKRVKKNNKHNNSNKYNTNKKVKKNKNKQKNRNMNKKNNKKRKN